MTAVPMASAPKKMSFAKVVASGPKENISPTQASRVAVPAMEHHRMHSNTVATPAATFKDTPSIAVKPVSPTVVGKAPFHNSSANEGSSRSIDTKIAQSMKDLALSPGAANVASTPSLVVNGSSPSVGEPQGKAENGIAVSDDVSQRADSSSEIGTKAPSLDGKSITSGTTFALDEKESLRPDDSASVKAAGEDDEPFSVRGSQMANSRIGSEVARVHRLRLGDMPERRIIQLLPESQDQGVVTPQSGSSGPPPPVEAPQILATVAGTPDAFSSMYAQNPDEKLIEAMSSPKDRLFLLRLEHDVINFVQSSTEPYMDLPPNNSFCRMLTHKLADYYHMTHSFEAVQGAVRIYRTPFCRVPPSLASLVGNKAESNTETTPPVLLPKKIMRRGEENGSGNASGTSKGTSEDGSDGKDKAGQSKEKLSREQREEAYNKARERIFGSSEKTGESTPDNEEGVSRASSVSAREKSNLGKRGKTGKQRRDDSESFDSRSQYQAYYNPGQPGWTPHYIPVGNPQYNGQLQQPYPNPMAQAYPQPVPTYPQMMPQVPMNGYPQYGPMPTYPQQSPQPAQPPQQRYPPASGPVTGYGSPLQNMQAVPAQQGWQQPVYNQAPSPVPVPAAFQQPARAPSSQPQGNSGQSGIPYAFGQLPANANPNDPKSQHPIPGSYNRHAFNPKTQSFVPGSGMSPVQPPMAPFNMNVPHGSPQIGSPHMGYSGYSSPAPPQPYMGGPPSYGMSRQSSNNSLPPYHSHATPPQHLPQHPGQHLSQMPSQMAPPMGSQMTHMAPMPPMAQPVGHQMQNKNMQGPGPGPQPMHSGHPTGPQTFSSLPNYGNPATLPQKPPTGI
ncbi:uncharacterized protein BCR38DRAFT_488595 [Pseudomassariella vexata]|uniref:R3H domain-containing protein n=1 Tax=Pseudomassariella vexata TaxID=1141098 RepID=A0A1Y2DK65_9PEZI|nr:uncharacterized protein BCR38DRAFT_488595 [Pseudomassariella vexata]ORY59569.1 hypothetical protein BCR38DRAFT_488595 [Pseudomassariella vexata]